MRANSQSKATKATSRRVDSAVQQFERIVDEHPEAIAVQGGGEPIAYGELDARANHLALQLVSAGVQRGDVVGVLAERGAQTVIGMLGAVKAGAAYAPLEPDSPRMRTLGLLEAAQCEVVVAPAHLIERLECCGKTVVAVDRDFQELGEQPERLQLQIRPDDLFAVMFTSGSTGEPKAIALEHRNLLSLLDSVSELTPRLGEGALHVCAPQFDVAAFEIWATLLNGGRLVCHAPGRPDPRAVCHTVVGHEVTWVAIATSIFHQLVESGPEPLAGLRLALVGGEVMLPGYARRFTAACPATRLFNTYGPAETTVFACMHEVGNEVKCDEPIPIGTAIAGAHLSVRDEQSQPVPRGEVGELVIAGPGVSRGYLHRPDLVGSGYSIDPSDGKTRLYHSGDLVREGEDGSLQILGRIDNQVKVSGYRVSPTEIEANLTSHPLVRRAAVVGHSDRPGHTRLHAFVAPEKGARGSGVDGASLRAYLAERLPSYMVPSAISLLDELPVGATGKVDKSALPLPMPPSNASLADRAANQSPNVAELFAEVLGLPEVGPREDFLELGGDSLMAVQLLAHLRERFDAELPISAVFEHRTPEALETAVNEAPRRDVYGLPSLRRRVHERAVPASVGQAKALLVSELAEESLPYQSQALHRILGTLDVGALERSLSAIVARHEILRTTFTREQGVWMQSVHEPYSVRLPIADLSGAEDPEQALAGHFAELCHLQLHPAQLPLARWSLMRLSAEHHALAAVEHHVVHDGVSTAIFLRELASLYRTETGEGGEEPRPISIQYRDFASWQHELVSSPHGERTLAYWRKQLADPPKLELPLDSPRPQRQTYRGHTIRRKLPTRLADALDTQAHRWQTTPFTLMLSAYCALLARYGSAKELIVGSALANRRTLASEELIGMLVNTVALRVDMSGDPTTRELIERAKEVLLDAQNHQDIPFEQIVEHVDPERRPEVAPLYQTLFSFHDAPVGTIELSDAALIPTDAHSNGSAKADLSAVIVKRRAQIPTGIDPETYERIAEDGLTLVWEYNSDLFERSTAERMIEHYIYLLKQFTGDVEDTPVLSLPLEDTSELERRFSGPLNSYERDATVADVFEARLAEGPQRVALTFDGHELTYLQLDRRANRLAHRLRSCGIESGGRVCVCMDRSIDLIVALLAIAKAGAAYVPFDPRDPSERVRRNLATLEVPLVLSLGRHRNGLPGLESNLLFLDDELDLAREPDSPPERNSTAMDAAYVMFTSGSTGIPKGVEVTHRGVVRLIRNSDYVSLGPRQTMLAQATVAFDASTFEIWGALLNGGRLVLMPPGPLTPAELADTIIRERVTTLLLPTAMFHRMVDDRPDAFRSICQLMTGGDVLSPDHAHRALAAIPDNAVLTNMYGPTEAATAATAHTMKPGDHFREAIPIGRPTANNRVYILDSRGEPTPIGVPGELTIGGDGVALGYAGDQETTADRFLSDRFRGERDARMYRTGDLARWRNDGSIDFLGRVDRQLKVRGFRVEPGEIEETLRAHPCVADAFVSAFDRSSGDRGLAAYFVPAKSATVSEVELRAHAGLALPAHAVPVAWTKLESLPLTINGKIDVSALPKPTVGISSSRTIHQGDCTPRPPDELERRLISIWKRTLDLDAIDLDADFFELGGHSLLAVELFDAIERSLGLRLPLAIIFEAPTVRRLAKSLREEGWKSSRGSLVTLTSTGARSPLFFVSAGDGNSVGFGALARRLGPDQPFYALQPRGMNGGARLHGSVEAMAAHYVSEIRRIRPHGPYLLGGRCLGAVVAYEMARRLEHSGEQIALLTVLDSGGPLWQPRPLADGTPFDEVMSIALRRGSVDIALDEAFTTAGTERLLELLAEPVLVGSDGTPINRYLHEIYIKRADVRDAYPNLEGEDALWFVGWAWTSGRQQLDLTERLLPPAANPEWELPIKESRRQRLASLRGRIAWRASEALDLITAERREGAAMRRAERVRELSLRAWHSHRAGPYGGVVTLIRSEEFRVQPGLERWHYLDSSGVVEHHVRGTHRSMMREPDVESLAACVSELVAKAAP